MFTTACGGHILGLCVTCIYHFPCLINCTFTRMYRTINHMYPLSTMSLVLSPRVGCVIQSNQLMVKIPLSNLVRFPFRTLHQPYYYVCAFALQLPVALYSRQILHAPYINYLHAGSSLDGCSLDGCNLDGCNLDGSNLD